MSTKGYKPDQIVNVLLCKKAGNRPTNDSDSGFQDMLRRMNFPS